MPTPQPPRVSLGRRSWSRSRPLRRDDCRGAHQERTNSNQRTDSLHGDPPPENG
jgi:hypothetical protein